VKSIALIGFMGSGKSTIGPLLAEALGEEFIDLDNVVTEEVGKTVGEIFAEEGEAAWRQLERKALKVSLSGRRVVLSCGGGIVLDSENRKLLKDRCLTVYLQVSPEVILERLRGDTGRPLLDVGEPEAELRRLYSERLPIYETAADITVSTDKKTPAVLAQEILSKIEG
jgi:shikimate kinase